MVDCRVWDEEGADERKNLFNIFWTSGAGSEIGEKKNEGWPVEPPALQVLFGVYIKKRGGLHL